MYINLHMYIWYVDVCAVNKLDSKIYSVGVETQNFHVLFLS